MEKNSKSSDSAFKRALHKTGRQLKMMLPVLLGVILLVGLFKAVVTEQMLATVFTGFFPTDALFGAGLGSIMAGNPVNSYVLGYGFLELNVSLVAVAAFLLTWVTVGIVQLPVEISTVGLRFALVRTVSAFLFSLPLAWLVVWLRELLI
ncbi:MAG: permease [bacterium]